MPSIFVSFRKVDNRWMRDRIYQALSEAFGANEIFKSGESIPAGGDFGAILRRQAAECKVMLVLIGAAWSDVRDGAGGRLLDRQDDWVRLEIATALRAGNRVIPVLLGDTVMLPAPVALPDDIAALAQLQFLRVPETHLDDGLNNLVAGVSQMLPQLAARIAAPPTPAAPAAAWPVSQDTGGGNAIAFSGQMSNSRVAGGNIRETKVGTGGVFATVTAFLTTKAGAAAAVVVVAATAATVAVANSGSGSSGAASANISADQSAVADVAGRVYRDVSTLDYAGICTLMAPQNPFMAGGPAKCADNLKNLADSSNSGSPENTPALSVVSAFTIDPSQVTVTGDTAEVPTRAVMYNGRPVVDQQLSFTPTLYDWIFARVNGQWLLASQK